MSTSLNATRTAAAKARFRRHAPTGATFVLADRIDYLNGDHWDYLTRSASLFQQRRFARALEEAAPVNLLPRYALVYRDGVPIAAINAQFIDIGGDRMISKKMRGANGGGFNLKALALDKALAARASALQRVQTRLLVCGNVMSTGAHGVAIRPGIAAESVWPAISEALLRLRRAEKLGGHTDFIMIKDFVERDPAIDRSLSGFGYSPLATEPNMVLRFDRAWRSHDDYVASLAGRYRKEVERLHKRVLEKGCAIETLTGLDAHAERLDQLYLAVHANAAVRLVTVARGFLPALERHLGEDFRCTVIRREGTIVGFVTNLRDGDTSHGYLIGYDRAANEDLPLYFRLLHASIANSFDLGCRELSLGRTALEPKARLGATQIPMSLLLRHRFGSLRPVLAPILQAIPHDDAPERHPFA
jgi:hypothetical protein